MAVPAIRVTSMGSQVPDNEETAENERRRLRAADPRMWNTRTVAEDIRRKIHRGDLQPYEQLPSTRLLMEHYGVGNNAVSTATDRLAGEGWIERQQGRGRYVRARSDWPSFQPSGERLPRSEPFPPVRTRRGSTSTARPLE